MGGRKALVGGMKKRHRGGEKVPIRNCMLSKKMILL